MRKAVIIILILVVVGAGIVVYAKRYVEEKEEEASVSVIEVVTGVASIKTKQVADEKLAIVKAKELWRAKYLGDEDLSSGPCLSNNLIPGWVADIAHNPRETVDELPENQCSAYRDGIAQHFVELDPGGNLIRAL